ncbi:MAG: class I SAM-dependent methyltransferase [Hyphomicrobiales bacterium]|nr:class I SAM-dependent methyltransferase [Hyphomicrobiales bacterium]
MPSAEAITAGQAIYTPITLGTYDWGVLGFSNRFLWRCPTTALLAMYQRNISANHLDVDVGVGTGYFLDRVAWPAPRPKITLLDLNPNCLTAAARRIARYAPTEVTADIFQPLPPIGPFDSVALSYLLHCLPGDMNKKAIVFDHLKPVLAAGARVFGATIVQDDAPRSAAASALMRLYNRKGVFCNESDTTADLTAALEDRFVDVIITCRGTVSLFEARAA